MSNSQESNVLEDYRKHTEERAADGIVPLPLSAKQTADLVELLKSCLLYTSPSPRDGLLSRMPSSA